MTKYAYKDRAALCDEHRKLIKLDNPRIKITTTVDKILVEIDLWCDGDNQESDKVMNIAKRHTRLVNNIIEFENDKIVP